MNEPKNSRNGPKCAKTSLLCYLAAKVLPMTHADIKKRIVQRRYAESCQKSIFLHSSEQGWNPETEFLRCGHEPRRPYSELVRVLLLATFKHQKVMPIRQNLLHWLRLVCPGISYHSRHSLTSKMEVKWTLEEL